MSLDPPVSDGNEDSLISEEEHKKIDEVRRLLGPVPDKLFRYCSDQSICRYLRARGWNVKKAAKMMKESIEWRLEYKPEQIRWEDVAHEAETGKVYRSPYTDKQGRTVLVMRPSRQVFPDTRFSPLHVRTMHASLATFALQIRSLGNSLPGNRGKVCKQQNLFDPTLREPSALNSKSTKAQIKYLVYCMENAIMNLPENLEEMVWLIDFDGFNLSNISVKSTRETAHVLQEYYPERLGLAILYNPPKFFEPFYMLVKPFLEPKTANKVKFVYSSDPNTMKIMEDTFDVAKLEPSFGGKNNSAGFEINKYAEIMQEDDKKMTDFWAKMNEPSVAMKESELSSNP